MGQIEEARKARTEVPEEQLLDISIVVFDPGLPQADEHAKEDKGIFASVRKSESRFIAVRLMDTLQSTGYWGAVRVVPADLPTGDLVISGKILKATGLKLVMEIRAVDATGRQWLKKKYRQTANPGAYGDRLGGSIRLDPFQWLYNRVANDLLDVRQKMKPEKFETLRTVANLRFAADIVPSAFEDYLKKNRRSQFRIQKLPAQDDPMMARIEKIRERDALLIDTLTEYYFNFQVRMTEAYREWQKASYREEVALRKVRRNARMQQILGGLAILGGILVESDSRGGDAAKQVAVIAGSAVLQSGLQKQAETKIHKEALQELAASLDTEISPQLVQLEGHTLRLTGSAEQQYASWRNLLREIFISEMGLPLDPDDPTSSPKVEL